MPESGKTSSGVFLCKLIPCLLDELLQGFVMTNQSYRKVMRLEPGDERRYDLADKGVLILADEIDGSASYALTLDFIHRHLMKVDMPVLIVLNSPGGDVAHGFAIFDFITAFATAGREVNILGLGDVASMATAIMQAGTRRYSFPNTQFLVHQIRQTLPFFKQEEVNEGRERQQEMDRINDIVMKMIADRVGIGLNEIKKLSEKKDFWLDAQSAKKFGPNGLIDEVVTTFPFQING